MFWIALIIGVFVVITILRCVVIVPQKTAFIVQRWGKYHCTLEAGLHVLVPFMDQVAYRHTLKEQAVDVPPQQCITRDNITVEVDGILYLMVVDPVRGSYGISNYMFATVQLSQTTMRSEIGKLELDRTFEERDRINGAIVDAVDKASEPWGIKVTRYEIKNISPPQTIRDAMEKQMRAEREKRALIAESEGDRQAKINRAEGHRDLRGREAEAHQRGPGARAGDHAGSERHRHRPARSGQGGWRTGRRQCRQPAAGRAVHRRVWPHGQDRQHDDHPDRPGQRGGLHQDRLQRGQGCDARHAAADEGVISVPHALFFVLGFRCPT